MRQQRRVAASFACLESAAFQEKIRSETPLRQFNNQSLVIIFLKKLDVSSLSNANQATFLRFTISPTAGFYDCWLLVARHVFSPSCFESCFIQNSFRVLTFLDLV